MDYLITGCTLSLTNLVKNNTIFYLFILFGNKKMFERLVIRQ